MSNLSEINVVILAGGVGSRLRSKVMGKPKVLAEVRKHPFLEYLLHQLDKVNFKKIILCTGYMSDQVKKAFGGRYKNLLLYYSSEKISLGTAGCLRKALPLFKSETILVMNGDSFCDVDFLKFWQFHLSKNSNVSIVLSSTSDISHYGNVKLGNDESVIRFQEKKRRNEEGFVSAGIYLINKDYIAGIPQGKKISIEKDVFPNWVGKGFYGYKSNHDFIDIGTPESYIQAEQFFAKQQL